MSNPSSRFPNPADTSAATSDSIGSPRNFVLACLGLLSLLTDEIPAWWERSVQRGSRMLEQSHSAAKPRGQAAWQGAASHSGLLTHHDLELLQRKVDELERQIDQIAAQRAGSK